MRTTRLLALAPLASLLLAGCAARTDKVAADSHPVGVAARAAAGTSTPTTCRTGDLSVKLGAVGHSAGSSYRPVVFTNQGSTTCTMSGFPGRAG